MTMLTVLTVVYLIMFLKTFKNKDEKDPDHPDDDLNNNKDYLASDEPFVIQEASLTNQIGILSGILLFDENKKKVKSTLSLPKNILNEQ